MLDADGNEITDSYHIGRINPYRYRGYYFDEETGLYYLQSRYYDPETGRFINADTVEYLDPESINGLNLYAYCGNNPVMYSDPSGHMHKWLAWTISGVLVVAGLTLTVLSAGTAAPLAAFWLGGLGSTFLAAGVGSIVGGYANEAAGGSFTAGYVGGLVSGALIGAGAGFGGGIPGLVINLGKRMLGRIVVGSLALSFGGGFLGNLIGDITTAFLDNAKIDPAKTVLQSLLYGSLNMFVGSASTVFSTIGSSAVFSASGPISNVLARASVVLYSTLTESLYDLLTFLIENMVV